MIGQRIRLRGIVQGVGMRPTVWRLAREYGLCGEVWNDAAGVMIHAWGEPHHLDAFVERLQSEASPLARIEEIECQALDVPLSPPADFRIRLSREGEARTGVAADAATCPACLAEVMDPTNRRYRYPFTNCTHCGPRLSIIRTIPYDRTNTSMTAFAMCPACQREYEDPADRRFHAQPNACSECGPTLWLEDSAGKTIQPEANEDTITTAARLLREGSIVAIKGLGGIHLACDAGNPGAVAKLRQRKQRYHKAFALMAQDLAMVKRHATVSDDEAKLLSSHTAPIVVLEASAEALADGLAPGQHTLGFMLPYTPLHHLLLLAMERPIVLTSGNRSDEPQCTGNEEARARLDGIADAFLLHDRDIVNRLDDSVLRLVDSAPRFLRRARGYAPEPIQLDSSLTDGRAILAMGGELKNTFCLLRNGEAILSQHMGDLEDAATLKDFRHNLALYCSLFDFQPDLIVVDKHPNYLSTQLGKARAAEEGIALVEVQHHHAHIAAAMAEHGLVMQEQVLGVALDGLGMGENGQLWGGEFLIAGYGNYQRLGGFQPVTMPGGAQAIREPWRNTLAHLWQLPEWPQITDSYADLEILRFLQQQPLTTLQTMVRKGLNSPPASSAGRLFDAVAAALGVCREQAGYEGHAAIELETLATPHFNAEAGNGYDFDWRDGELQWPPLWRGLLEDLDQGGPIGMIAARFHHGLAHAIGSTAAKLAKEHDIETVVLSGGVIQNRLLLERLSGLLREQGLRVIAPRKTPANDGGLSLGQAVVALASTMER